MRKVAIIVFVINLVIFGGATFTMAGSYVSVAEKTGISIIQEEGVTAWTGPYGGKIKPNGPLAGKKIGLIVGCEFSDWQAYYLASFIGEFGGTPQFVMNNNHLWKETRPMRGTPTEPHGMWGLSLTGGMDGLGLNGNRLEYPVVFCCGPPKVRCHCHFGRPFWRHTMCRRCSVRVYKGRGRQGSSHSCHWGWYSPADQPWPDGWQEMHR